jgi:hypothetical protein
MTKKQVRFLDDYGSEVLWATGLGWPPGENWGEVSVEDFNFSEDLQKAIKNFQQISLNYWAIMEKIPGGGWSIHSEKEFETARLALGLPEYPSDEMKKSIQEELIKRIKLELPIDYELIEEKPLKADFPQLKDILHAVFFWQIGLPLIINYTPFRL